MPNSDSTSKLRLEKIEVYRDKRFHEKKKWSSDAMNRREDEKRDKSHEHRYFMG
jgi:hypothetical protein